MCDKIKARYIDNFRYVVAYNIKGGVIIQYSYSEYVPIIKALSDETRLKIVDMLSCGSLCACEILNNVNISQSTLSYHMKLLTECELVNVEKDGSWMHYSINTDKADQLMNFLSYITNEKSDCICSNGFNQSKNNNKECLK